MNEDESPKVKPLSAGRFRALVDIDEERECQEAKWGNQSHPGIGGYKPEKRREQYAMQLEYVRALEHEERGAGRLGWDLILLEEVYEALEAEDTEARRTELVQAAAVIIAWIEDIDSREK